MTFTLDLEVVCDADDVPEPPSFEQWIRATLDKVQRFGDINIRIVDTDESQTLNHQYRGKDKPTNVLSFPFDMPEGIPVEEMAPLLGDLAICAPIVKAEAAEQKKEIRHHWAHMVVHGTLHLLGYDHINDAEAEEMEQLERDVLATFQIPDPYQGDNEV